MSSMSFEPRFIVSDQMLADHARIERARGLLEAASLCQEWILQVRDCGFVLKEHPRTHIEGTVLTLEAGPPDSHLQTHSTARRGRLLSSFRLA